MEENLELEQDVDVDIDDDADLTDVEVETDSDNEDGDEGVDLDEATDPADDEVLEYDEDGNVIVAESDDNEAAAQVEERETKETDNTHVTGSDDALLIKRYEEREAIIRDTLKAMGIEEEDIDKGLAQLAAETKGMTFDEYTKERAEARKQEEAQRVYKEVMLQRMIDTDMNELHSLFPETKTVTKFEELPNARRYAELRDMGLSPKEAYSAANPEARREAVAASVKQQAINASKSHLKSNVPIASKDTSVKISRGEMEMYRDMFPEKSDKEIIALYKKTK